MPVTSPARWIRLPLAEYPSINPFALDLVTGGGRAAELVSRKSLNDLAPHGAQRDRSTLAAALERANQAWGNDAGETLARWRNGETVTLIAGQQVGFAGGPLYTLAKIASLLRMRDELAARGIPATVFFWMATEDHDYDEISTVIVPAANGVAEIRAGQRIGGRIPVGRLPLPEDLRSKWLAGGFAGGDWLSAPTFGESFARLLASTLRGAGVVLVDSLQPELRAAGAPVLCAIAESLDECEIDLRQASDRVKQLGYTPQVEPSADGHYSLLYWIDDRGERAPIRKLETGWTIAGRKVTREELDSCLAQPERISTGASARPLLQDFVFEPDVFLGGPAEVSYYAQLGGMHARLGVQQPHVALRGHALVATPQVMRAIERYEVSGREIFAPPDALVARRDPNSVRRAEQIVTGANETVERELDAIRTLGAGADRTIEKSIERSLARIRYQFGRAGARVLAAVARRDRERFDALARMHEQLVPHGKVQDRILAWLPFAERYPDLLARFVAEIEPDTPSFKIVGM